MPDEQQQGEGVKREKAEVEPEELLRGVGVLPDVFRGAAVLPQFRGGARGAGLLRGDAKHAVKLARIVCQPHGDDGAGDVVCEAQPVCFFMVGLQLAAPERYTV